MILMLLECGKFFSSKQMNTCTKKYGKRGGPLFLPSRSSWRGAHNWFRGHIWLVVIRAFVASQANHMSFMIEGVKTQYPAGIKHGRPVLVLYFSSLFTLTQSFLNLRNFVANWALSRLRAFWGALFAVIWWRGAQKRFSGPGHHRTCEFCSNC